MLRSVVVLALAPALLAQDLDPVLNYCRLWDHQSVVKNGSLYIDGGLEIFQAGPDDNKTETTGYNTDLIQLDLTSSWNWKTNLTVNGIKKGQNPQTGTDAPLLVRSALYPGTSDDSSFYLYGGTVSFSNTSFPGWQGPESAQYALWSYSTTDKTWAQYDVSQDVPTRPNSGAYIDAPDLGLGFYHNGEVVSGSEMSLQSLKNFRGFVPGMVVVDTAHQTAKNLSTDALQDTPRARHRMVYIPGIGEKGILVTVGGVTKSVYDGSSSSRGSYLSMANVDVFDVASMDDSTDSNGTWHRQQATGDVPDSRADFCLVTSTAPDNSSYNIYMYGGRDDSRSFDEIYVLSLPSFKWVKVWTGNSPRWGHTCHVVGNGNSQMITVGGVPDTDFTNGCDWETSGVAIYSLSNGIWGSVYNAFDEEYQVPSQVYQEIGGDATGKATTTSPSGGFGSKSLEALFNGTPSSPISSSTSSSSNSHKLSKGGIAGAVIGSLVGAAALIAAALVFFFLRRRRQQQQQQAQTPKDNVPEIESATNEPKPPSFVEADSNSSPVVSPGAGVEMSTDSQARAARFAELGGNANENGLHEMPEQGIYEMPSGSGSRSKPRRIVELP